MPCSSRCLLTLSLAAASTVLWLVVPRATQADGAVPTAAGKPGPSRSADAPPSAPRYGRDIRPILSDRCFTCHGPDPSRRKAKLRLDEARFAVGEPGSGAVIIAGDPEASELWARLTSEDHDELMPPADSGKRALSTEERALIKAWIESGATYEPHWAFVAPSRPAVPAPAGDSSSARWPRNDIDRFLLRAMESRGVAPSSEADRATLARRLFLDLTGLPPTPEEVASFVADQRPDAYERLVDTLLTTEPYRSRHAEHMAVPWLDAARYADTSGIHMDAGRQMWLWRDWVLQAYRDNMPFDRFLAEQLAGDLLADRLTDRLGSSSQSDGGDSHPHACTDGDVERELALRIASGFNRNHVTSDEGGAIDEEYLLEYAVDRASTTASVFLGLTMGCARCHDHKYDPISQEEFYGFLAFFNSVQEPGVYSQSPDANRALEPALRVPTVAQRAEREAILKELAALRETMDAPSPDEEAKRLAFLAALPHDAGVVWRETEPVAAASSDGATLKILEDRSVLASGANPARDDHLLKLRVEGGQLRLLLIEALTDPSLPHGRVGRAANGNAVLSGVEVEAVSLADDQQRQPVRFVWSWADIEQRDGDHAASNILESARLPGAEAAGDSSPERGWAVAAHQRPGQRALLLLSEAPFGFEEGTELRVRLGYRSPYDGHSLGRLRIRAASLAGQTDALASSAAGTSPAGLALLPVQSGTWHVVGPFPAKTNQSPFEAAFGPEESDTLDRGRNFDFGNQYWRPDHSLQDDRLNALGNTIGTTYVGRQIYVPTARSVDAFLGSDDGVRVFLNGEQILTRDVERSLARDQDRVTLPLRAGVNTLVLKVVNTGGEGGFFWRLAERVGSTGDGGVDQPLGVLPHDLVAAVLPEGVGEPELASRMALAWRLSYLPEYLAGRTRLQALERQREAIDAASPQTMVMRERPEPRETFVMQRGLYDQPDRSRPVQRQVPTALGAVEGRGQADRLALAEWMLSPANPLTARVAANRLWEQFFGHGLVRTSEDFGLQGEWPSHPELLDWLAVEFREPSVASGVDGAVPGPWDLQHLIRLIVGSSAYRQQSVVREDLREIDPENRLLAWFPRRRLGAEQTRDQALHVSGLLVEHFGGPSVKPYQPEGLWQEVAMPGSNTRVYAQGSGNELWRRSLYTYWKRAAPPPSLLTFDAPTRETCTIKRASTSSPLQALVLWNDVQFVEAARVLAERTLAEPLAESQAGSASAPDPDQARLARMFMRCVGRQPLERELAALGAALDHWRGRYADAPADAMALVAVGEAARRSDTPPAELASWTMIASSLLSLHATNTRD